MEDLVEEGVGMEVVAAFARPGFVWDSGAALGKGTPKISFLPDGLVHWAMCFINAHLSCCHFDSFRN